MDAKRPELEIVSGCQSGVDRAALDAALEAGVPCGGWCPKGRAAEDGPIDARYPLHETPSSEVQQRTEWNVRDSDGTLILSRGTELTGGTLLTQRLAQQRGKPCLAIDLNARPSPGAVIDWMRARRIRVLNVAGPRESGAPGIHQQARAFMTELLASAWSVDDRPG
jgi:hypothetical protein